MSNNNKAFILDIKNTDVSKKLLSCFALFLFGFAKFFNNIYFRKFKNIRNKI